MSRMTATVLDMLEENAKTRPDEPALGWVHAGEVHWRTWGQIEQDVANLAIEFRDDAQPSGYRHAALWDANSYGWVCCDLALQRAGLVVVPLHASLPEGAAEEASQRYGAGLPKLGRCRVGGLLAPPPSAHHTDVESLPTIDPRALACIQPTSGTSGEPRGVMLTHAQLAHNARAVADAVTRDAGEARDELRLSFLPFSHLYARVCDLYAWVYRGSRLVLVESRDTLFRDLQIVQPTSLNGVPYFYQKVLDRAEAEGRSIRDVLGGQIRQCFCGGAALAPSIQQTFADAGVPLMNGYGLSEASPVVTASSRATNRIGTVGQPIDGVEVEIADDGEVLVRGPCVMQGYWDDPDATAKVLRDGWLHTGDLGRWDEAGHLVIEGRKKETLVLSTGHNVSPSKIESLLCQSPWIEQACVVGEGRKHLAALVVPNPERLRAEVKRRRLWVWSKRAAVGHAAIREIYQRQIAHCLAECPPHEQVGAFTLLTRGFSIEHGEMTAKLSLRRAAIEESFAKAIETLYT